ncbi:MAG: hypothetical protein QOJ21_132 [Solirubrobacteraceae bacterium]|nr:hypothetical protein [Solirubrobacteraceae bacterium]
MRLRPRTWGKVTAGVVVIGGTLAGLWAAFRPSVDPVVEPKPRPRPPALTATRAVVLLQPAGSAGSRRATISCDGPRRAASGFWGRRPAEACDALASTRAGLLAGSGCRRLSRNRDRLHVSGAFGSRRFDVRQQSGGCPDPDGWLAVDALAAPVLVPQRKAADAGSG